MQESPVYQYILEKGRVQGFEQGKAQGIEQGKAQAIAQGVEQGKRKRKYTIEAILELLDIRFQVRPTGTFFSAIESIDDLPRLKELLRAAVKVESLEAFRHILEHNDKSD